jgi:voltage-gated sodium channel
MQKLKSIVESNAFTTAIMVLIVINAITLALETSPSVMAEIGPALSIFDKFVLAIFGLELAAKLAIYRTAFFKSGWNVFDLIVVGIALVPASGPFAVVRALRVFRVLRLVSLLPQMRRVVEALIYSLPGMASISLLMGVVFFVAAVITTSLFGPAHPGYFGTLGDSLFTLFAVMTLEGWADVAREVQTTHPYAYLFFVPFIIISVFAVLNLFIAVLTNSMQELHKVEHEADVELVEEGKQDIVAEIAALREEIRSLRTVLADRQ